MYHLPVTGFYAAIFSILIVYYASRVIRLRWRHRVDVGDGGHHDLTRAIRVHANAIEYIPISLLLLACYELNHGHPWVLHGFGIMLLLARILHFQGFGFHRGTSFGRFFGISLNWIVILGLAVLNVIPTYLMLR